MPKHTSTTKAADAKAIAPDVRRDVMKLAELRSELRKARQRLKAARKTVKEAKKTVRAIRKRAKLLKRSVPRTIAAAMAALKGAGGRLVEEIATAAPRDAKVIRPPAPKVPRRSVAQTLAVRAETAAEQVEKPGLAAGPKGKRSRHAGALAVRAQGVQPSPTARAKKGSRTRSGTVHQPEVTLSVARHRARVVVSR